MRKNILGPGGLLGVKLIVHHLNKRKNGKKARRNDQRKVTNSHGPICNLEREGFNRTEENKKIILNIRERRKAHRQALRRKQSCPCEKGLFLTGKNADHDIRRTEARTLETGGKGLEYSNQECSRIVRERIRNRLWCNQRDRALGGVWFGGGGWGGGGGFWVCCGGLWVVGGV